jgi:hypothetical protein
MKIQSTKIIYAIMFCIAASHLYGCQTSLIKVPGCLTFGPTCNYLSICNATYTDRSIDAYLQAWHGRRDSIFGVNWNGNTAWNLSQPRGNNSWSSGSAIAPFTCQRGWVNFDTWFTPVVAFDGGGWSEYDELTSNHPTNQASDKRFTVRIDSRCNGGTLWLVPNIRHAQPSYADRIPPYLLIPVGNDDATALDQLKQSPWWCTKCGQQTVGGGDGGYLPGCRGCQRDGDENQLADTGYANAGMKLNKVWPITQDGRTINTFNPSTYNLLNTYFNYVFLDTVKNDSGTKYYVATTSAPINTVISEINNSSSGSSALVNMFTSKKINAYPIRIYDENDQFNKDGSLSIQPHSSSFKHKVSQAALNTKIDTTTIDDQKSGDDSKWNVQTIILVPSDYGAPNKRAIIIGRTASSNFHMYTYGMYTDDIASTLKTVDTKQPITKDTLMIGYASPGSTTITPSYIKLNSIALEEGKTARLGIYIDSNGNGTKMEALAGVWLPTNQKNTGDFSF